MNASKKANDKSMPRMTAELLYYKAVTKAYQAKHHVQENPEYYKGLTIGGLGVGTLAALGEVL